MPDQSVAFQFWPALLTEEPDFVSLAVFADFCEDHQWPQAAAVRWLVEEEAWPVKWESLPMAEFDPMTTWDWWSAMDPFPETHAEERRATISEVFFTHPWKHWVESPTLEDALTWFVRRYLEVYRVPQAVS